jgi:hypothetical protein
MTRGEAGNVLSLHIANETNIDIELVHPVTVRLPQGDDTITMLRLHADDPAGFLDAARRYL